ncbi:acetylglutamate kinase [Acidobacteria bacterium AH-259-O06]|nr:acetylglutamate kinase [Acidobacteria bacterium AH-259-O06]
MILIIKLSGKVLEETQLRLSLCGQIAQLAQEGHRLLIVHGGGKQLTALSERLGIPIVQHQGRRVTDEATLELATMVFSAINCNLVSSLIAWGLPAIGISAFDAKLTSCRRRPPIPVTTTESTGHQSVQSIDFGLVGEIKQIDVSVLSRLWESALFPVVSCLGADDSGQILNINADTLAAELAVALQATRLISVSDVEGIYLDMDDPSSRLAELSAAQARKYLSEGRFTDGMAPKIEAALQVLERGVGSVQILSGLRENALLQGLMGKAGTLLTKVDQVGGAAAKCQRIATGQEGNRLARRPKLSKGAR